MERPKNHRIAQLTKSASKAKLPTVPQVPKVFHPTGRPEFQFVDAIHRMRLQDQAKRDAANSTGNGEGSSNDGAVYDEPAKDGSLFDGNGSDEETCYDAVSSKEESLTTSAANDNKKKNNDFSSKMNDDTDSKKNDDVDTKDLDPGYKSFFMVVSSSGTLQSAKPKRAVETPAFDISSPPAYTQDPQTGAWNIPVSQPNTDRSDRKIIPNTPQMLEKWTSASKQMHIRAIENSIKKGWGSASKPESRGPGKHWMDGHEGEEGRLSIERRGELAFSDLLIQAAKQHTQIGPEY